MFIFPWTVICLFWVSIKPKTYHWFNYMHVCNINFLYVAGSWTFKRQAIVCTCRVPIIVAELQMIQLACNGWTMTECTIEGYYWVLLIWSLILNQPHPPTPPPCFFFPAQLSMNFDEPWLLQPFTLLSSIEHLIMEKGFIWECLW